MGVGVVAGGGWSGGVWGLEWWCVGVGVVVGGGSSGGMRELEWWSIQYLITRRYGALQYLLLAPVEGWWSSAT